MNQPPENTSNNLNHNPDLENSLLENVRTNKKKTKAKKPKMHDSDFSLQSIIQSVAGIGLGSTNDFSFAQIGKVKPIEITSDIQKGNPINESVIDTSVDIPTNGNSPDRVIKKKQTVNKPKSTVQSKVVPSKAISGKAISKKRIQQIIESETIQTNKGDVSKKKRSKKINKTKLQKVFNTDSFKRTHSTTKVMGGLIKLAKQIDPTINAKEFVSELVIKWILKEEPAFESKILQMFDQYLEAE